MEHLLIIEDDKVDQMAFERYAKSEEFQYSYTLVNSIKSATKILKSTSFDAIVSDFFLGDGTTFDILELNYNIPIVVTTGTGSEEIAVSALKKGAYDYLIKDIEGNYLKMLPITVKNALHRFKSEQELKKHQQNLEKLVKSKTKELQKEIEVRKQAEIGLRKLNTAVEQSPVSIVITDINGILEYTNPIFTDITGFTSEEVVGSSAAILNAEIHSKIEHETIWNTISSGKKWEGEFQHKKKNGTLFWEQVFITPIVDSDKNLINYCIVSEVITERKKAEDILKKSAKKYQLLKKAKDKFGQYSALRLFLIAAGIIIGYAIITILSIPYITHDIMTEVMIIEPIVLAIITFPILYYFMLRPLKIHIDIGKQVEEELRKSELKYRSLIDQMNEGLVTTDTHGIIQFVNKKMCSLLGYTSKELIGFNYIELFLKDSAAAQERRNRRNKGISENYELEISTKSGEKIWVLVNAAPHTNLQGVILGSMATLVDITQRKKGEEKLLEQEERLLEAQRIGKLGYLDFNLITNKLVLSPESLRMFGFNSTTQNLTLEELTNRVHPNDLERVNNSLNKAIKNNEDYNIEHRIIRPDGTLVYVKSTAQLYKDASGKPIRLFGINLDITNRKESEKQLVKMNLALHNSNEVIFMTNKEGIFTYANPQFTKMYGYTNKEIIDKATPRILKSGFLKNKEYEQLWGKLLNKESVSGLEYKNKCKNGKLIDVESSFDPIINDENEIIGFMGIQRDITERMDASETLHKRESLLNAIFESTGDGMLVVDNTGKVTHSNTEFNKMWKIPPELINTIDDEKLIAFVLDQFERPNQFLDKVKELYKSSKSDYDILYLKDGRVFERNSEPLIVNNVVFGRVWGFKDISERKHAEKLQKVLYNISNAVITTKNLDQLIGIIQNELGLILDTSNFYIAFYDKVTDTFSTSFLKDEKISVDEWKGGKSLSAYVVKNNKPLLVTKKEILKMQQAGEVENFGELAEVWMGVPLKVEDSLFGILAVQSYKSKKSYSNADLEILSFVSEHISSSIYKKQVEENLINALEKATESDRLKTAFLQNISHEIRTPMNGILGFASLLSNTSLTGEKQQQYIEIIAKSGTRMLNTLNDLMDISRLETQQVKLSYAETNVNHELGNLYAFFKPEAERKELLLTFHTSLPINEAYILTDHQKFFATLSNLIKNAIKYTPHGNIDFGYELKGEMLEFYVKDTGIGVPLDRQQAIFDRFVQADIEDKKVFEGVGLGLSISKSYIEMLEGEIWVDSVENVGSTFYFTIPYKTTESEVLKRVEQKSRSIKNTAFNKLKVLIAEDEESAFLYLNVVLENVISQPIRAKTGLEAVEIAKNNPDLDLILMDIKMPVMGGYEATRKIRKFNKEVIIIAETAYALPSDRDKAIEAGCNEYMAKPIDADKLLKLIKESIKKK
tara:strand:+ start:21799 stop:26052 length:4254 start_codon:yes stop_codon:yes gene_type:complete